MNAPFTPWPDALATDYRRRGLWAGLTFSSLLEQLAFDHGDRIAVIDGPNRLSYITLLDRSQRVAAGLSQRGLQDGDVAVVQAENSSQYLIVLFALFRIGVVPVCALPAHRGAEIGYFCSHTEAAAYLHPDGAVFERLAQDADVGMTMTVAEAATTYADPRQLPPPPDSSDLALLQLSGGSTGVPKLIPRTHDDYLYSVRIAAEVCRLDTATVYLCVLPAAHNFPLSSPGVLGVLHAGGRVVMAPDPSPDTAFALIESEQVTITATVPALALAWLQAAESRGAALPSLATLQVGGARLGPHDARQVRRVLGAQLQQVFGMAEGLVCYTRFDDPFETVCGTQGRPASAEDEVLVVDDDDEPVPEGHSGHLLTRGPYTIRGYYRADAHNRSAFTADGHYRTGDLVRRTATGHLIITGRAKEQINRGGEKIATAEVEEHLRCHPGIHDAALVAIEDAALGERACAFCVTDPQPTPKQVRAFLRERGLAAYKIPDLVRFVDELPRTPVGKIDKNRLKEIASV